MTNEPKPKIECPACNGTGIAEFVTYRMRDGLLTIEKGTCWMCNGTGKVEPDVEVTND